MSSSKFHLPAFPVPADDREDPDYRGMSLRDYFAAKALQGICAHTETWGLTQRDIAARAYFMADLMMEAREA